MKYGILQQMWTRRKTGGYGDDAGSGAGVCFFVELAASLL